jgi:hypothetical protein
LEEARVMMRDTPPQSLLPAAGAAIETESCRISAGAVFRF